MVVGNVEMRQVCEVNKILLFNIHYILPRELTLDCLVWNLYSARVKEEKTI
jgi:hypothetical protein